MNIHSIRNCESIDAVVNALTVGGVAVTCAVVVAFSNIPGLAS